jgi:transposase InsO family protein
MCETSRAPITDTAADLRAITAGGSARLSGKSPRRTFRRRTLLQVPTPQLDLTFGSDAGSGVADVAEGRRDAVENSAQDSAEIEDLMGTDGGESRAVGADVPARSVHGFETAITPGIRSLDLDDFAGDLDRAEELGQRTCVVRAMLRGLSAREALIEARLPETRVRWAQKLLKTWNETQRLTDGRWERVPERTVLTPEVVQLLLLIWNGRRRAGARAVWRRLKRAIQAYRERAAAVGLHVEVAVPSYETVRAYIRDLPKSLKLVRDGGMAEWTKHGRPFVDYEPSDYANHVAQIDHCRLKIWIRVEVKPGVWAARVVWFTVVFDVHSRAVMGYQLSTRYPDQWTMALALRHAILPKADPNWPTRGIPEILVPDQGADFMSHAAARLCRALGITVEPTPPYYPDMKAELERFFGTVNSYLAELVGFMPADGRSPGAAAKRVPMLLTLSELRAEIERFLVEYHARPHSGIDNEAPAVRWLDTVRHLALPASEEDLNVLLLKDDVKRIVTKGGIRFTAAWQELSPPPDALPAVDDRDVHPVKFQRRGRYWAPELMDYLGEEVRLAYNPEDLASVLVYSATTGERLCEAWLLEGRQPRATKNRVVALRNGYRKKLKERTAAYVKEVEKDDRRSARANEEARELSREITGRKRKAQGVSATESAGRADATAPVTSTDDADVAALAADIERRARGEA